MVKIHRVQLEKWKDGIEPRHCDIYDHARRLLGEGVASSDMIETYTPQGTLSMSGIVGECAKWSVRENSAGAFYLKRWEAFPGRRVGSRTGETAIPGIMQPEPPPAFF